MTSPVSELVRPFWCPDEGSSPVTSGKWKHSRNGPLRTPRKGGMCFPGLPQGPVVTHSWMVTDL